ncbi:MAG: hypothetical protein M0Z62_02600 [Actinomycetota bacterium]|nr:hypothetical protein [Actinomycetota bacterium]
MHASTGTRRRRVVTALVAIASLAPIAGVASGALVAPPAGASLPLPVITTVAGNGTYGSTGNGGPATSAEISDAFGITTDPSGNVLLADSANGTVRMVAATTCASSCAYGLPATVAGDVYVVAGGGSSTPSTTPQAATQVALQFPDGLAVTSGGDVVIADQGGPAVDLLEEHACSGSCPYGLTSETPGDLVVLAGLGTGSLPSSTPAPGTSLTLNSPTAVTVDPAGDIVDAEYQGYGQNFGGALVFIAAGSCGSGCPWGVPSSTAAGDAVLLAGGGATMPSSTPTPAAGAMFGFLNGVTDTPQGNLVVSGASALGPSTARIPFPSFSFLFLVSGSPCASSCPYGAPSFGANQVLTVAGGGATALATATPSVALGSWNMDRAYGVASDPAGNLLVALDAGNTVAEVPVSSCPPDTCPMVPGGIASGTAALVAGTGAAGFSGDGGPAIDAELQGPTAIATSGYAHAYIVDTANLRVRELVGTLPPPPVSPLGYWVATAAGDVYPFGSASSYGGTTSLHLNGPIVGMAPELGGMGYWLAGSDGGVFAFGSARFEGSLVSKAIHPATPVVGIASTSLTGYLLATSSGDVYPFGTATSYGTTTGLHLNEPIVSVASVSGGYYLAASDGGVFAFGSARFEGSLVSRGIHPSSPVVAITATSTDGYLLSTANGQVYAFGSAVDHGNTTALRLDGPIVGMASIGGGSGYVMAGSDGGVFAFGSLPFRGSLVSEAIKPATPVTAVAVRLPPV